MPVKVCPAGPADSPYSRRAGVLLLAVLGGVAPAALGGTKSWIGASGSWSVPGNWGAVAGQPADGDIVLLRQSDGISRIITFDSAATAGTLAELFVDASGSGSISLLIPSTSTQTLALSSAEVIGEAGKGLLTQDGGTQTISSTLLLGSGLTGSGTLLLRGGTLSAWNESIGDIGKGTFNQSGGTHLVNGTLLTDGMSLGAFAGSSGTYILSVGSLAVSAPAGVTIGAAGFGAFTQNSGTFSTSPGVSLVIGTGTSSSSGRYSLVGGTLLVLGDEDLGHSGIGTFSQTGGTNTIGTFSAPRSLFIGNNAGSAGTYTLSSGGALIINGSEIIGAAGAGTLNQSAGGHSVGSAFAAGMLAVGYFSAGTGNFLLSGTGSLSVIGEERIGSAGAGTFTHSGGTHTVGTASNPGLLSIGHASGGAGTYLLSGSAVLNVNGIETIGADGAGTFNQTGGAHTIGSGAAWGGLYIGFGAGTGTYLLGPAGTLTTNGNAYIGYASSGTFSQSGGVHVVGSVSNPGTLMLGVASGISGFNQLSGSASLLVIGDEIVGFSGSATVDQSAGNHAIGTALAPGEMDIAFNGGSSGTYVLSGTGSLIVIGHESIGLAGNGTFNQTGGAHALGTASVPGDLSIGNQPGSNGTYLQSGTASLMVIGDESIGESGNGAFSQSGGTHTLGVGAVARNRYIGAGSGSSGQYILSGSGVTSVTGTQYIGYFGFGTFDQSGGTQTIGTPSVAGAMRMGVNPGSAGTYLLSGSGVLRVNGDEHIGENGAGNFLQTGGTHTIGSATAPARLLVGAGTYSLSNSASLSVFGDEIIGATSTASRFIQSSGLHSIGTGSIGANLYVGAVSGSTASFSLSGGSLGITGDETIGASGSGTLAQSGGTHTIGGAATPRTLYIGRFSGGSGTLLLSGAASLTVNGNAFVGGGTSSAGGAGVLDVGARASISGMLNAWGTAGTSVKVSGGTLSAAAVMNDALFTQAAGSTSVGNFDSITAGAGAVTLSGGTLTANRLRQGTVSLSGSARVKLNPDGGNSATSVVSSLGITSPAQFDLNNNDLIVDYTGTNPTTALRQMLADKRITSSASTPLLGLGYAESASLLGTFPAIFSGQSVDATSVLIKFTFLGDANLDGRVNTADLTALATHWQQVGQPWVSGDFNYDGRVDLSDLYLLASNWKSGAGAPLGPPMSAADLGSLFNLSVPEPGTLTLLCAAGAVLCRRRSNTPRPKRWRHA